MYILPYVYDTLKLSFALENGRFNQKDQELDRCAITAQCYKWILLGCVCYSTAVLTSLKLFII